MKKKPLYLIVLSHFGKIVEPPESLTPQLKTFSKNCSGLLFLEKMVKTLFFPKLLICRPNESFETFRDFQPHGAFFEGEQETLKFL